MIRTALFTLAAALALSACGDTGEPARDAERGAGPERSTQREGTPPAYSPEALAVLTGIYADANLNNGRRLFRRCAACHTVNDGGRHLVGPNLSGMFSRGAGEAAGYNYSPALRDADFDWTPERLDEWLADPRGFLPGNRMSFVGLRTEAERLDVIAYIMVETAAEPAE